MPPSLPYKYLITATSIISLFVVTAVAVAISAPQWGEQPTDQVNSEVEEVVPTPEQSPTPAPVSVTGDFVASINFISLGHVECESGKGRHHAALGLIERDLVVLIPDRAFKNRNETCKVYANGSVFQTGKYLNKDGRQYLFVLRGYDDQNRNQNMTIGRLIATTVPKETAEPQNQSIETVEDRGDERKNIGYFDRTDREVILEYDLSQYQEFLLKKMRDYADCIATDYTKKHISRHHHRAYPDYRDPKRWCRLHLPSYLQEGKLGIFEHDESEQRFYGH
ncbi:MAG: hypothetical protein OYG31_01665 [Candidatus Kaiserbacteria bacterium]|nr:hypothetical protein [Candidatus Kaiserbacteria bacterium]